MRTATLAGQWRCALAVRLSRRGFLWAGGVLLGAAAGCRRLSAPEQATVGPADPTGIRRRTFVVATDGSDRSAGSWESPFRTLARAVEELGPGVEIVLRQGRHVGEETVILLQGGDPLLPAVIRPAPGEQAILRCREEAPAILAAASFLRFENLVFDGEDVGLEGIVGSEAEGRRCDYLVVHGCQFLRHRGSGLRLVPADEARIVNCRFARNGRSVLDHGIYVESGDGIVVEGCVAEFNRGFGLHLYSDTSTEARARSGRVGGTGIVLRSNLCRGNGDGQGNGCGIVVGGDFEGAVVENNVCLENHDAGILVGYSDLAPQATVVRNNTCYANVAVQVGVEFSGATHVTNNLCDPGGLGGATLAVTGSASEARFRGNFHAGSVHGLIDGDRVDPSGWVKAVGESLIGQGDPRFRDVRGADFRLLPESDAIDAGSTIPGDFAQHDFDGVARPIGAAPDPGAFEAG